MRTLAIAIMGMLMAGSGFSQWIQQGNDIDGEAVSDASGGKISLSADGSIVAIGATENDGNGGESGHVRVYQWDGAAWIQSLKVDIPVPSHVLHTDRRGPGPAEGKSKYFPFGIPDLTKIPVPLQGEHGNRPTPGL